MAFFQSNFQSKPNPFLQLAQQCGSQPNPFLTQTNNSMDVQSNQFNQYVFTNQKLSDQIKNLKINGLDVFGIDEIKLYVGDDCGGIDVVCGSGGKSMAIKYLDPINMNQTKEIAYFEYCCNIFQNHFKCKLERIIISVVPIETSANTAINRCGIFAYVNSNKTELFQKTLEHVGTFFM